MDMVTCPRCFDWPSKDIEEEECTFCEGTGVVTVARTIFYLGRSYLEQRRRQYVVFLKGDGRYTGLIERLEAIGDEPWEVSFD